MKTRSLPLAVLIVTDSEPSMFPISNLRTIAEQIFHRTLAAIDIERVVRAYLHLSGELLEVGEERCDLAEFRRILVIAVGKAGLPMSRAVEAVLGERITGGLVVTNALIGKTPDRLRVLIGGHPLPNQGSVDGAKTALNLLRDADGEDTLILFLISGGGSALFETPIDERITLEDLQTINRVLVGCGAVIGEMNIARRFLSAVKGGRLAQAAPRSRQISLYVSDVNSGDLSTVSSGPAMPSAAIRADFDRIVARYDLLHKFPARIAQLIDSLPDLPRSEPPGLRSHHLLLDNAKALRAAQRIAESDFGCVTEIAEDLVEGEVAQMAVAHLERLNVLRARQQGRTVCLISGGEVICPVRGDGQGGRNQEFVLRAAMALEGMRESVVLSAGTDGIDGNSPADGAIADERSVSRARASALSPEDYLDRSDSYRFFEALGDAIITGPTGNNVRDLRILLAR
jgi:glycerate 2-kinase